MPTEARAEIRSTSEGLVARVTLRGKERKTYSLPTCRTEQEAQERGVVLAQLAARFRKAKKLDDPITLRLLDEAAAATAALLPGVLVVAGELVGGMLLAKGKREVQTFATVAEQWTSGDLHERYPDHVRSVRGADMNKSRLDKIGTVDVGGMRLGDVPIGKFTLEHAEIAMRNLPPEAKRPLTRRAYAVLINRVLGLAVYPLRLISASPLPRGFVPKMGKLPAYPYLYPDEEAQLMACTTVPLWRRVLWGTLAREGMRKSEAIACARDSEVDLKRGALTLDKTKTDDPRAWALGADVVRALDAWCKFRGIPAGELLFTDANHRPLHDAKLAELLRADLETAEVKRADLHHSGENRRRIRAHDLRGTFVTLALAAGRTETWVADRTGHKSSTMINRYRRAARQANELGLGWLAPLDEAIPELRPTPTDQPAGGNQRNDRPAIAPNAESLGSDVSATRRKRTGIEPAEAWSSQTPIGFEDRGLRQHAKRFRGGL